jgi:predicted phosphoribosyltransferase
LRGDPRIPSSPARPRVLGQLADEVVCPYVEEEFYAVGEFYRDFSQVSDEVVVRALAGRL